MIYLHLNGCGRKTTPIKPAERSGEGPLRLEGIRMGERKKLEEPARQAPLKNASACGATSVCPRRQRVRLRRLAAAWHGTGLPEGGAGLLAAPTPVALALERERMRRAALIPERDRL